MDTKHFGKKLREYRMKCGWSIEVCAEKIGISTRYLADIERGDKVQKLETFILILNTLAASADDVLQNSLVVGDQSKSNDVLRALDALDITKRGQALQILESVISALK